MHVYNNTAAYGGGLYIIKFINGLLYFTTLSIFRNTASLGGGVYFIKSHQLQIIMSKVFNNKATKGGGFYFDRCSELDLLQSTSSINSSSQNSDYINIENNKASQDGGGLYFSYSSHVRFIGLVLHKNYAILSGGGIYFDQSQSISLSNSEIRFGIAELSGGGIAIHNSEVNVSNTKILDNKAKLGGGISVSGTLQLAQTFTSSTFIRNVASYGGAIGAQGMLQLKIGHCGFAYNIADSGGAIYLEPNNNKLISYVDREGTIIVYNFDSLSYPSIGDQTYYYDKLDKSIYYYYDNRFFDEKFNHSMGLHYFCPFHASSIDAAYEWNGIQIFNYDNFVVGGKVGKRMKKLYDATFNFQNACPLSTKFRNNSGIIYGHNYATKIWRMKKKISKINNNFIKDYSLPFSSLTDISFDYVDYFNHSVTMIQGLSTWTTNKNIQNCQPGSSSYGYLSGITTVPISSKSNFTARCFPGKTMSLQVDITPVQISTENSFTFTEMYSVTFRNCTFGEYIVNDACVICPDGSYALDIIPTKFTTCSKCPADAKCVNGEIVINEGFWRNSAYSITPQRCPLQTSCQGGRIQLSANSSTNTSETFSRKLAAVSSVETDSQCYEGYTGVLCGTCTSGYYMSGQTCKPCSSDQKSSLLALIVVPIVLLFALAVTVFFGPKLAKYLNIEIPKYLAATIKIVISFYQIVSLLPYTLNIVFPVNVTAFYQVISYANIFNSVSSPQCAVSYRFTYFDTLVMRTCAPIGVSILILVAYTFECCRDEFAKKKKLPVNLNTNINEVQITECIDYTASLKKKYTYSFLFLCFLVLPSVTVTIFGAFICVNVDPDKLEPPGTPTMYMYNDLSVDCNSSQYIKGVIYAVIMILLYPIGIPLFELWSLYRVKQRKAYKTDDDPASFLYSSYRVPHYLNWDIIETGRRLTMTAVLSVLGVGTDFQVVLGLGFALLFMWMYALYHPFKNSYNWLLQILTQFQIVFTFVGALLIRANVFAEYAWASTSLNISLLIISISSTVYALHLILIQQWSLYQEFYCRVVNVYRQMVGIKDLTPNDITENSNMDKYVILEQEGKGNLTNDVIEPQYNDFFVPRTRL